MYFLSNLKNKKMNLPIKIQKHKNFVLLFNSSLVNITKEEADDNTYTL